MKDLVNVSKTLAVISDSYNFEAVIKTRFMQTFFCIHNLRQKLLNYVLRCFWKTKSSQLETRSLSPNLQTPGQVPEFK